jgi:hypothetical protein
VLVVKRCGGVRAMTIEDRVGNVNSELHIFGEHAANDEKVRTLGTRTLKPPRSGHLNLARSGHYNLAATPLKAIILFMSNPSAIG